MTSQAHLHDQASNVMKHMASQPCCYSVTAHDSSATQPHPADTDATVHSADMIPPMHIHVTLVRPLPPVWPLSAPPSPCRQTPATGIKRNLGRQHQGGHWKFSAGVADNDCILQLELPWRQRCCHAMVHCWHHICAGSPSWLYRYQCPSLPAPRKQSTEQTSGIAPVSPDTEPQTTWTACKATQATCRAAVLQTIANELVLTCSSFHFATCVGASQALILTSSAEQGTYKRHSMWA